MQTRGRLTPRRGRRGPLEGRRGASGPRAPSELRSHFCPHPLPPTSQFYTRSHSCPEVPRTMTIGHIPRHSVATSNLLHTWSPDTGWYTGVTMSHMHTMASLRDDTRRPPHPRRIPAPHLHTRRCTSSHAPGHTWPHRQVRSAPHFSCLLPSRVNWAAPGRGCSV